MMPIIPSKDTIATLHQLHPLLLDFVFPHIFDYKLEHTFVLDRILFAQALTTTPHLFLGGFLRMVYEHFLGWFIPKDPSSRFSKLFQATITIAHENIFRSMALMLEVGKLLAMAKDTDGFHPILVSKVFLWLINHSIVLQLWRPF